MIAVVIPYFKIRFFDKTLKSLVSQTNKDFKVYIGDDFSPDSCEHLLNKFSADLNFLYKKFDKNLGSVSLVQQWHRCIDLIESEEWVMILGDDDYLEPNVISSFYENLSQFEQKCNVVRFAKNNIFADIDKKVETQYNPILESAADSFYRRISGKTMSTLSEYIFKKSTYDKFKFHDYPVAWHSDNRAWIEFAENKPIFSINEAVVNVICSEQSITGCSIYSKEKKQANLNFYKYLILEKLVLFTSLQSIRIIHKYERELASIRKLNLKDRAFLFPYYIKNFEYNAFKNNLKKIIKTFLAKN